MKALLLRLLCWQDYVPGCSRGGGGFVARWRRCGFVEQLREAVRSTL